MGDVRGAAAGIRRGAFAVPVALLCAGAALAAAVGGGFWPSTGPCRIAVKRAGLPVAEFHANLRFLFDGAAGDASGTGSILAYDEAGQDLVAQFPFRWTTGRGARVRMEMLGPELEAFLEERLEELTGRDADLTLETAGGRAALRKGGTILPASLKAAGDVLLDGLGPYPLRVKLRLR